ncbi:response regulator transcription factor [Paenibacillus pabuli]|uniref:response regulator transcription factor n=1 Tax=Paenibacillus pabuli TaxID=1472 RepID=UPI000785BA58|nr:response regulator transcription factor [Paenibacillus pabuli]MEC0128893.1 response regulator transcription factor [Paenibacillus pabuli]
MAGITFDQKGDPFDCTNDELDILEQVGKRIGLFLSRKEKENTAKTMAIVLAERESTVRDYVSSLMTKLRAKNRTQVVAYAFRWGLLS